MRNYQAALCQKSSDLIDDGRTLAHENGTHSMHRLNVFLLDRFDANKAHCRSGRCFDERLNIVAIVLLRLDELRQILRTYKADFDTQGNKTSRPMMRRAASLHHNDSRTKLVNHLDQCTTPNFRAMPRLRTTPCTVKPKDMSGEINAENIGFDDEPPKRSG